MCSDLPIYLLGFKAALRGAGPSTATAAKVPRKPARQRMRLWVLGEHAEGEQSLGGSEH